ncbi:MAG: MBL fold metallo-hydrolase [Emergencia sp.]
MKQNNKERKLSFFNVAALYVGTLMGAGFASGREGWQFFGVFGTKGFAGLTVAGALFMIIGMMVSYIARTLDTDDMGRIIVCVDSPMLCNAVGYVMAGILYTIIVSMSAAGGSFLNQQFGFPQAVGGAIIVVMVIITVLGDFERISKVFRLIVPALFTIDVALCIIVIASDIGQSGATSGFAVSSMAKTWLPAALLFISYNMLGMIPVVGKSSVNARSKGHGLFGAALGGFLLALLTFMLLTALRKDMAFTDRMDLPMLAYSARISPAANVAFGAVLFLAIYSAATSTYYGFSTKIKDGPKKKYILIAGAFAGFLCGLTGFKAIVAYLYPVEGYLGFIVIASITINFIRIFIREHGGKGKEGPDDAITAGDDTDGFEGHDRFAFPENLVRVTAGAGGETVLIFGSEKTALYDCGMAYCHEGTVKNIEREMEKRGRDSLDYVLISHTHYDHIGALPYILKRWPSACVCGAAKAESVFRSEGARRTMKRLGEAARDDYSSSREPVLTEPLRIDRVVREGDRIELGNGQYFSVLETRGHTDCSMTYVLEPDSLMFTSESTGIIRGPGYMHTAILKSYTDTMESAEKCRAYGARQILCAHYGLVPESFTGAFFDMYEIAAQEEKDFILEQYDRGLDMEQILEEYDRHFWSEERGKGQPRAAFLENARYIIGHIVKVFRENG